jgi:hypothetical protein
MTSALERVSGQQYASPALYPLGKSRYPLYRRLGGPHGRFGLARKISPPTGIRSLDRLAFSQSLYRLIYPAHNIILLTFAVPVFNIFVVYYSVCSAALIKHAVSVFVSPLDSHRNFSCSPISCLPIYISNINSTCYFTFPFFS